MGKRRLRELAALVLLLLGLLIFCCPMVRSHAVHRRVQQTVSDFVADRNAEPQEPVGISPQNEPFSTKEHTALWKEMQAYNHRIRREKQEGLSNRSAYERPSFRLQDYGLPDEVFGVLTIPKMKVEFPIYLGATDRHLTDGVAHLSQTSLPIGGADTHAVIAGHRGWRGAPYLQDILVLEPGDEVIVQNLWQTLRYTVAETEIIEPNEIDAIRIQEGRELLTLLTCHPYGTGGRQRYLVICERQEGD